MLKWDAEGAPVGSPAATVQERPRKASTHEAKKIETTHKGERTTMPKAAHKVVVIGHRNPDTDSICSAIAYAELKNRTSTQVSQPSRARR